VFSIKAPTITAAINKLLMFNFIVQSREMHETCEMDDSRQFAREKINVQIPRVIPPLSRGLIGIGLVVCVLFNLRHVCDITFVGNKY
jgi:hypothetical protein